MSSSESECILPYLDVHKRLSISICSPWFRKWEKQTYIYFDELEIESSKIKINNKYYKFGEILDIENTCELDNRKVRIIKKSIRKTNLQGGNEWKNTDDDILEPGDVILTQSPDPRLEQQKIELMNKLRQSFMEELEKYSNSEITVNPLDVFEQSVTECIDRWPNELLDTFRRINKRVRWRIDFIFWKHPLLENKEHSPVQPDDISEMYPNAFNLMTTKIEEMNRNDDVRVSVLEKLAYPPVTVPHFNQFTVLGILPEYSNRVPERFSIRNAFKHFLSVILTGRQDIRIGKFKLEGDGIIPLPVGLKFDCEDVDYFERLKYTRTAKLCETIIGRVDRLNLMNFEDYQETFSSQMVQSCKQLYIKTSGIRTGNWESELQFLENEVTIMELSYHRETVQLINSIRSWASNTCRKIGSKLFIALSERVFPVNAVRELMSGELREMGFIIKENYDQSMYLLLSGNKRVELTFHKHNRLVPREFSQRYFFNRFFFLEIVESK